MRTRDRACRLALGLGPLLAVTLLAGASPAADRSRMGYFGGVNLADMGGDMQSFGDGLADEFREQGGTWNLSKKSAAGAGLGVYYFLPRFGTYGIQVEAQYVRRGVNFDLRGTLEGLEFVGDLGLKLNYVEVPVLLRISPLRGWADGVVFLAGPVVGLNTSADLEVELQALGLSNSDTQDIKDSFKTVQFGAIVGIGFSGEIDGGVSFLIQSRYYQGLSNAFDSSDFSSRSGDLGFFVGMEFGLGG